jgi:hypothetical protein
LVDDNPAAHRSLQAERAPPALLEPSWVENPAVPPPDGDATLPQAIYGLAVLNAFL